jgi:hypothetical protein
MIMTDPFIVKLIEPGKVFQYSVEAVGAIGVIAVGKLYMRWKISRQENEGIKDTHPTS